MAVALQLRVLEVVTPVAGGMLTPLKMGSLFNTVTESDTLLPSSSPSAHAAPRFCQIPALEAIPPSQLARLPALFCYRDGKLQLSMLAGGGTGGMLTLGLPLSW